MLQKTALRTLTSGIFSLFLALPFLTAQPVAAQTKNPVELADTGDVILQGSVCAGSGCANSGATLFVTADTKVGVGTAAPTQKFEVAGGDIKVGKTTGGNTSFFIENTGGAFNSSWILRANSSNGVFTFTEAGANTPFRIFRGAAANTLDVTTTGVNVVGSLRVNGTTMTVPDYVFEPTYDLLSIEQQGEYMRGNKHLPAVGGAEYDGEGRATIDLGAHQMGILEELEKAHLYIQQVNAKIEEKDDRIDALEARLARLEAARE